MRKYKIISSPVRSRTVNLKLAEKIKCIKPHFFPSNYQNILLGTQLQSSGYRQKT